jgi:cysteine desulfurase
MMTKPIYLDYQATTPLDGQVLAAMMPYLTSAFGNPHSTTHRAGREAKAGVEVARMQIASLIDAQPEEIIFTSGATEANNLALRGVMELASPTRNRLVTVATEHSCVIETARDLVSRGFALTVLPVQKNGLVDLSALKNTLADDVAIVSVMAVNNEIGVIQPIQNIAESAHASGALFHTDAAQAFGKIPLNVVQDKIDLMSISAHKIYGPKGIGALYVKKGVNLRSQITGGGQEFGIRSGTLSPALCAGFGAAAKLAVEYLDHDHQQARRLFEKAFSLLAESGFSYVLNGDLERRLHNNLSLTFQGIDGARLISDARSVMMSTGAACASQQGELSHVLAALGVNDTDIKSTIRLGFGRDTTMNDIEIAMKTILDAVALQALPFAEKLSA